MDRSTASHFEWDPSHAAGPREFLRVMNRQRGKALAAFLLISISSGMIAAFWPAKYGSDAKLFVQLGRQSVGLDPTATTGHTIALSETRETEINSILDIFNSRAMHERVLESVPPEELVDEAGELTREQALVQLARSLSVGASKRSNVITIHSEAKSPELAQRLVAALLKSCLEQHVVINRTAGAHDFFYEQAREAEQRAEIASAKLRDAKNEAGLVSVDSQRQILQSESIQVNGQILAVESSLVAARTRIGSLRAMIEKMPERVDDDLISGLPNVAGDGMKQKLYELQIQEKDLAARVKSDHPQLVRVRQQLRESKSVMESEPEERQQSTARLNRLRETLELSEKSEGANLAAYEQQLIKLREQASDILAQSKRLNENELTIARLQRDVEMAEACVRTYGEKLELTRVNQKLDDERISNLNVVQNPTLVLKPTSPKRLLIVAGGLMMAVFVSIAVALGTDAMDRSMHSPQDVEHLLRMPVVATLPRVADHETLLN